MLTEPDRATKLRKLVKLVHDASNTIINEWEKTPEREPAFHGGVSLPSEPLYNAQRVVEGATGAITELISEPQSRLIQLSGQYFESRALHIAAEHRIAQLLHDHGEQGLHVNEISKAVGIERGKLGEMSSVELVFTARHAIVYLVFPIWENQPRNRTDSLQHVSFAAWPQSTFFAKVGLNASRIT